jgi:hypothetical protein
VLLQIVYGIADHVRDHELEKIRHEDARDAEDKLEAVRLEVLQQSSERAHSFSAE